MHIMTNPPVFGYVLAAARESVTAARGGLFPQGGGSMREAGRRPADPAAEETGAKRLLCLLFTGGNPW